MENENKWEYDYSASNNETGYPNVGSSGMNTANQYNEPEAQPARPADTAPADGGSVPPTPPEQPQYSAPEQPEKPRRKKKFNGGKLARSAVALVLAAAMGFAGGFVGAKYGGGSKVVIQQVERPASSDSSTDSTGNSISATSGTGLSTAQVAEMVSPSVVVITTEQVVYSQWSWYGQSQVESGAGSGVIISSDGYILTCAHVVSGASNITVSIGDKDYPATLVGEDTTSDIAVVKVDATGLTPATVGNSDSLKVGESVMAVGNPLGELGGTVTSGIVSALNRSVSIQGSSSVNTMSLIQMDASVSPGNSGGGLFNMNGELVGIVNAKSSDSDAEGLGFAIPVNDAVKVAQELLENGYVTGRPYLGISYYAVTDAQTAAQLGVNAYGVYIVEVVKGGPADKAGLQAGDRIVSVDGSEVATQSDLGTLMQNHKAGDTIDNNSLTAAGGTLAVLYDMSTLTFEMKIDEKDINKVQVGQEVTITADAVEGVTFSGVVDTVNINGTTVSGQTNYPVTVVINDPQDLKPGMNVSADIIVERAGTVLCVPVDAVNRGSDKPTVQVAQEGALDENGNVVDPSKLETREVTLGRNDNDNIEITSGLSEGEIVVWVNEVSNPFAAMMGM